jgi:hypothetical protein
MVCRDRVDSVVGDDESKAWKWNRRNRSPVEAT